jgi:hypothetical protein
MLAVVFSLVPVGSSKPSREFGKPEWDQLLAGLGHTAMHAGYAKRVYLDGLVRIVTDQDITIIKRNERRHWTASMAREDAEATMLLLMHQRELAEEEAA